MDCHKCNGYGYLLKSTMPEAWRYGYRVGTCFEELYPGCYSFIAELKASLYRAPCPACNDAGAQIMALVAILMAAQARDEACRRGRTPLLPAQLPTMNAAQTFAIPAADVRI